MHFKGPFHFGHIQEMKKNNKIENGIYIQGLSMNSMLGDFQSKGLLLISINLFTKSSNIPQIFVVNADQYCTLQLVTTGYGAIDE